MPSRDISAIDSAPYVQMIDIKFLKHTTLNATFNYHCEHYTGSIRNNNPICQNYILKLRNV